MSVEPIGPSVVAPPRSPKPQRADRDLVHSLVRALELLEILAEQACRLTELARRANLPASTTHRLLTTLEQKRFVCFDREDSLWAVSSHCYAVGSGFLRQSFLNEAAPLLNSLARQLGAVANLGVLEGGKLKLVRQAVGCDRAPIQPPGTSLPLHASAMGKILLAGSDSPSQSRGHLITPLPRLTEQTICDPTELARELRQVKKRGVALDNEESLTGRRCLAAPVHDGLGNCVAAISITATPCQMTDAAIARMSAALLGTVSQISRVRSVYSQDRVKQVLCI